VAAVVGGSAVQLETLATGGPPTVGHCRRRCAHRPRGHFRRFARAKVAIPTFQSSSLSGRREKDVWQVARMPDQLACHLKFSLTLPAVMGIAA